MKLPVTRGEMNTKNIKKLAGKDIKLIYPILESHGDLSVKLRIKQVMNLTKMGLKFQRDLSKLTFFPLFITDKKNGKAPKIKLQDKQIDTWIHCQIRQQ